MTLDRTGDTALPLHVPLTLGGTAAAGIDFSAIPVSVTIPAGESTVTVAIHPIPDNLAQGDRSVTVAVAEDFTLVRDPTSFATVTIQDKPFDAWRFARFTANQLSDPAVSGATADPDHDQLANLLEYALDTDPLHSGPSPVVVDQEAGGLKLTTAKNPAASDVSWSAEVSGNLADWQPATILTDSATLFEARDDAPIGESAPRFIRLKITRP